MKTNYKGKGWQFEFLAEVKDPNDDNVDVSVSLADGSRYSATFFTTKNIDTLLTRYRNTGECFGGMYLWSSNMVIVRCLSRENIRDAINDMLKNGEFFKAFDGPFE